MSDPAAKQRVLDLSQAMPGWRDGGLIQRAGFALLERVLGYRKLDRLFTEALHRESPGTYLRHLAEVFGFSIRETGPGLDSFPESGPVIVVANHPFGGADAITVLDFALRRRPDTRILANEFLGSVDPLRPHVIAVDVFGGEDAARKNLRGIREASRHLAGGGQLVVFPAGEVASWSWRNRRVTEAPWTNHFGKLANRHGAAIVPVFLPGRNSLLFLALGTLHPFLRTAWLGRELLLRRNSTVELRIGKALSADREWTAGEVSANARKAVEKLR